MSDSDEDKTIDKFEGIKLTNSLIDAFFLFSKHVCKMWPTGPAALSLAQRQLQAQPIAVSRRAEISNFKYFRSKTLLYIYLVCNDLPSPFLPRTFILLFIFSVFNSEIFIWQFGCILSRLVTVCAHFSHRPVTFLCRTRQAGFQLWMQK